MKHFSQTVMPGQSGYIWQQFVTALPCPSRTRHLADTTWWRRGLRTEALDSHLCKSRWERSLGLPRAGL
jgi:hypothetical protein